MAKIILEGILGSLQTFARENKPITGNFKARHVTDTVTVTKFVNCQSAQNFLQKK
jgi:hypothetical protein